MKEYKKPIVNIISLKTSGILCGSGQKTYDCPIMAGVKCAEYNTDMQNWKHGIEHIAANKINTLILTVSDEMHCPKKTKCPIFLKWQKQQKTK